MAQRRSGDRYGLGSLGAALMGNPGVVAMIEHHAMLYSDLGIRSRCCAAKPKRAQLASYWPYARSARPAALGHDAIAPYTALMSASQPMIAQQVLSTPILSADIAACSTSAAAMAPSSPRSAAQAPKLRCVLFDLPAVADQASERFRREGLSSRAVAIGGSFLADRLPEGADIVSLVRVIHDHDDADVMTLLRAIHSRAAGQRHAC